MKKAIVLTCFTIFIAFIYIISIKVNILLGVALVFASIVFGTYIKNPKNTIENIILISIFLTPCANILLYHTGFYDLRILPFLWLVIIGMILIHKVVDKQNHNKIYINNKEIIFILYIGVLVVACIFSSNIDISIKELIQDIYLVLILYIIYINAKDEKFFYKIIKTIIISNIFLVTISLLSYIVGKQIIPSFVIMQNGAVYVNYVLYYTQTLVDSGGEISRLKGVFGLTMTGIANCILIQSMFVSYFTQNTKGYKRLLFIFLLAANFLTIILTYSRAAILVFLVVLILAYFSKNHVKNVIIVGIAVLGVTIIFTSFPAIFQRILETFNTQEGSSKYHFAVWIMAIKTGYQNIFTGIGLGNMAYSYDAFWDIFKSMNLSQLNAVNVHNFILQIWAEQGVFGLIINMILFLGPIAYYINYKFIKRNLGDKKTISDYIILAYIATLIYNLTNNNFYIETFWVLLALVYSVKYQLTKKENELHLSCNG